MVQGPNQIYRYQRAQLSSREKKGQAAKDRAGLRPPANDDDDHVPLVWEFGVDIARGQKVDDPTHFLTQKSTS